jgi:hypothetical protein
MEPSTFFTRRGSSRAAPMHCPAAAQGWVFPGQCLRQRTNIFAEYTGLYGFAAKSAYQGLFPNTNSLGKEVDFQESRQLSSFTRRYYEKELGAGIGPHPSGAEHFGYTEPFRRFVQHQTFSPQANEIPNTAAFWLSGDDYYTNFHKGDPLLKVDEGYARLPGAGYAALHPELKDVDPEDYPDIHKMAILADVAPYSREYNTYRQRVGRHPQDFRSGESEERKKSWKCCACMIFASGTLAGKFKRKSAGQIEWGQAREVVASWRTCGAELPVSPPEMVPFPTSAPRVTIERAVNAFHATHTESSAFTTQRMYRYLMNRFTKFSESKGYVLLGQWGPMDVREIRTSWGVAANTATKNMTFVKSFSKFAVCNEWLDRNPARLVKELRNRSEKHSKERIPFSDEELAQMFQACETKYDRTENDYRSLPNFSNSLPIHPNCCRWSRTGVCCSVTVNRVVNECFPGREESGTIYAESSQRRKQQADMRSVGKYAATRGLCQ